MGVFTRVMAVNEVRLQPCHVVFRNALGRDMGCASAPSYSLMTLQLRRERKSRGYSDHGTGTAVETGPCTDLLLEQYGVAI